MGTARNPGGGTLAQLGAQLGRGLRHALTPRGAPDNTEKFRANCVVHLEKNSAPRILGSGEDLVERKLPAGTRVIYPKPPMTALPGPEAAIAYALHHPENMD